MKKFLILIFFCAAIFSHAQLFETEISQSKSLLKEIMVGDSITYYQCHVEKGTQTLVTASGQQIINDAKDFSITEKYVLVKTDKNFQVKYYTASLSVFPNKKFSGLKIREKEYWEFKFNSSSTMDETLFRILLSLENKGREAMEYDYPITKYTTNQIIIKHHKNFKQLVIDGPYVISKLKNIK